MSRLKRQRLTTDGLDRVTSATDEIVSHDEEQPQHTVDEQQTKQQKGRSLFVRSLPQNATSETLTNFFSQFLPVKHATVVTDSESKKAKGYGFVTFADVEDAQNAKDAINGSLFEGQKIKVELAEPRHRVLNEDRSVHAMKAKAWSGLQERDFQHSTKLIVRNLPWTIREPKLLAVLFRSYGKIKHVTLPRNKSGLLAGFGFVVLRGRKNAERALEGVNGREVDGRTLAVDWAVEKEIWETLQNDTKEKDRRNQDIDAITVNGVKKRVNFQDSHQIDIKDVSKSDARQSDSDREDSQPTPNEEKGADEDPVPWRTDNRNSTLFIRNLPFSSTDESLRDHFGLFGPVRYARVVLDQTTKRPKGTGFVCYYNQEDADSCLEEAPKVQLAPGHAKATIKSTNNLPAKQSLLEDTNLDLSGRYTIEGRVLQLSRAVDRNEATRLTLASSSIRDAQDKDRRRLYLLSEGTVPSHTHLHGRLSLSDIKIREDSAKQRQSLIKSNPMLHLSLTRLSIRNLPRGMTSRVLKALAREAVVGFAKDVKSGLRKPLSKEELLRGGEPMKQADKARKAKGKGIVKQAKIVFEGREGGKVTEDSGAGRSRGYGFIEYSSHRWALMGLRWLNGYAVKPVRTKDDTVEKERRKRLIAEFAIENAQVIGRRQEREIKARERSRCVSENMEKTVKTRSKSLNNDQYMAEKRKGLKRRHMSDPNSLVHDTISKDLNANEENHYSGKLAKRQRMIGKKRMMRRSRNQAVSMR